MMCENATKLASDELDRRLSMGENVGLRLHLLTCGACSGFARHIRLMRKATRRYIATDGSDPEQT
ncbi:MAG: zf-HC2 domain-containing protein [Allorhizobium sp.]